MKLSHSAFLSAVLSVAVVASAASIWSGRSLAAEQAVVLPLPTIDEKPVSGRETIVLAGGCFWGVQGVFQHVNGVISATSGYAGGSQATAHYDMVGTGQTGHAESVRIVYDPGRITYGRLLQIYFSVAHDPTELNYQGPDTGTQYRSTIFAGNAEQAAVAKAYVNQLDHGGIFGAPVVTTIEQNRIFYPAEPYHQDFLTNNPNYPYIVYNDVPKIENLKKFFPKEYREKPVLVAAAGN